VGSRGERLEGGPPVKMNIFLALRRGVEASFEGVPNLLRNVRKVSAFVGVMIYVVSFSSLLRMTKAKPTRRKAWRPAGSPLLPDRNHRGRCRDDPRSFHCIRDADPNCSCDSVGEQWSKAERPAA
jgi:hypothetical protein